MRFFSFSKNKAAQLWFFIGTTVSVVFIVVGIISEVSSAPSSPQETASIQTYSTPTTRVASTTAVTHSTSSKTTVVTPRSTTSSATGQTTKPLSNTYSSPINTVSSTRPSASPALSSQTAPLFQDEFSLPLSGWAKVTDAKSECAYEYGEYSIASKNANAIVWQGHQRAYAFDDFIAEIDIKKVSWARDHCGGIAFRHQDDNNYFLYDIDTLTGTFHLTVKDKGVSMTLANEYSKYIKLGTEINHLKVICSGVHIQLYANENLLYSFDDTSFSYGRVMLASISNDIAGAHFHFDNLKIYR